jgi:hypothetical protein
MRFTGRWELLGSRYYPLVVANVPGIDGRWPRGASALAVCALDHCLGVLPQIVLLD